MLRGAHDVIHIGTPAESDLLRNVSKFAIVSSIV